MSIPPFTPNKSLSFGFEWKDYSSHPMFSRDQLELLQLREAYSLLEIYCLELKKELDGIKKDIGPISRCCCDTFFIEVDKCDKCHQPRCSDCISVASQKPVKLICLWCVDWRKRWDEIYKK